MDTLFDRKRGLVLVLVGLIGSAFGIEAPTGLTVGQVDYTQAACNIDCSARLSWTAPAEGTPTGYKIYRRLAAHEHPTLAGTVGADTTTFTDSTAAVGRLYSYTVTATDAGGESAESSAVSYRKLENVALASKGNATLNNPTLGSGAVANANDGALNNVVLGGNSAEHFLVMSFKDGCRPCLEHVRLNFGEWGTGNKTQKFYGTVLRNGTAVATEFNGSSSIGTHTFTQNAWNQFPVAAALRNDIWTSFTFGGGNWYGNCRELEAYGYLADSPALLGTPILAAPFAGDAEAFLTWSSAANAASYAIYRKVGEGAWMPLASGLTKCFYKDTGLTSGTTYTYRVAAVAANGDESSAAAGVAFTAQTPTDIPPAYGLAAAAIDFTQAACNIDCSAQLSWSLVSAANYDKVRVYRFIAGHEDETPAPVTTLDKATTAYTDVAAVVGQAYLYKVACYNSATDTEGPMSDALAYIRLENVVLASKGNLTLNGPTLENGAVANVNDGNVANNAVCKDNTAASLIILTFKADRRPRLVHTRLNFGAWGDGNRSQKFYGAVLRNGAEVSTEFNGSSSIVAHAFTAGAWNQYPVADSLRNDVWTKFTFGGGNYYGNCREVEAYGYVPGTSYFSAPDLNNPEAGRDAVSLSWTAVATASSYKVYRRVADGDWVVALEGVTATTASDEGVTFDGTTYSYRVAAVAANGDELSSGEKTVLCPAGAPFWWNFLNVKSVAFPGAAAYSNPSQVKPHFMSRDKAGTLLAVPMSTDNGTHPTVTFDFAALASADNLGELTTAQTGMKKYGITTDFGGGISCWKGAAVSEDLVVIGNGTAENKIAVIERATGTCVKYWFRNASGSAATYTLDGGLDFDASGEYLYSNDGEAQNKIVKWQVDTSAKTLKRVADYAAPGFTRIRNLAIYTVGGNEYAFFGEGSAKTGKIGALKLSDGTFTTLVTDATNLGGDIVNVKLAAVGGETYLVAQLDNAAVGVYALNVSTMTATLEKAIDAATMKTLYGTADGGQYRNFEMTADGRYAFVMNNAGAQTRLVAIGATEQLLPEVAPTLTATSDFANKFKVTLTWTEGVGVLAESVRLFRAQVGKPGAIALADVPFGTQTYVDTTAIPGVPYAYSAAYVHTVNGTPLAGVRGAEVEAMALLDLKTKKKTVLTSHSAASGTVGNLFDDNTSTVHGSSQWGEKAALQFTERVHLRAARYWPKTWGTIHRGDNLKVYGKVANGTDWTTGLTQVGTGPVVYQETWYDVTLNGSEAPADGWDYLVLASGGVPDGGANGPYLNLSEVDFYGASVAARATAMAKASESARDDAPTAATAKGHTLAWTENGTCSGVRILRARTAEGPFTEVARVAAGTGTFVDATAVDGVFYYYKLAYESEFEGVAYVGTPSTAFVDYGVLLSENGVASASRQYLRTTNPVIASDYNNGPDYLFDGNLSNSYNNDAHAEVGQAFREPVVVKYVRVYTLGWAASDTYPRADNIGIYGATESWSGTSGNKITSMTGAVKIGSSPARCRGEAWFDCTLTDTESAWSYLVLYRTDWYGCIREVEFYGYPKAVVEAAKTQVVWPVENVAARMDDTTLTLSWTLPNDLATSITVMHRVSGGAWAEVATLAGSATTFTDANVAIGRYNEYRFVVSDGTEVVWAAKDFAVCPLLSKGSRTALGCTATSAWDYLSVESGSEFSATFDLAGSTTGDLGLTGGTGEGKYVNLDIRPAVSGNPAARVQRHWVYGNTLGLYAYDPGATDQPYTRPWSAEGNTSTRFRIDKSGATYRLRHGAAGSALTDATTYTFTGAEPIGSGPCLVGVSLSDPNLATLPQIAPVSVKVSTPGLVLLLK